MWLNKLTTGKDGANTTGNLNKNFAYDAAAYSLGYFTNDYKAIDATLNNTANSFLASETNDPTNGYKQNSYDLYNGNISRMVTVMRDATGNAIPVQGRTFRYDQLNRIKEVNAWTDANVISTNNWSTAATNNNDYYEAFTFDMNGNIETAVRNGDQPGTHQYMDNMSYQYTAGTNKLDYVNDLGLALSTDYDMDIDGGQTAGNYQYDAIGNLTKDVSEEIDNIEWNYQGKIVKITRTNTSSKPDLEFLYDAMGQRIAKIVKPRVSGTLQTEDKWKYTIYARDASGNVMAVYAFDYKTMSGNNDYRIQHNLKEHHIYGGSRLGMSYDQQVEVTRDFTLAVSANGTFDFYPAPTSIWTTTTQLPVVSTTTFERELGYKVYELANHLGNVLATVSDRRIPVGSAGVISNFLPEVMTYTDYFVFGSNMPGRTYVNANGKYRYTFNGKEQDVESDLQDYGMRIYNPALARFLSLDPLMNKFASWSPYIFAADRPIIAIDVYGAGPHYVIQSATVSVAIADAVIRYQNGEINYAQLMGVIGYYSTLKYTTAAQVQWVTKKADEGGIQLKYTGVYTQDNAACCGYRIDTPYVVYNEGSVQDNTLYLTLMLVDINGKWYQSITMVEAPTGTYPTAPTSTASAPPERSSWFWRNVMADYALQGSADPVNDGGSQLSRPQEWMAAGAVLSIIGAPFTIAGGGVWVAMGAIAALNGTDDIAGVAMNPDGTDSFTQQLTSDPEYKNTIGKFKIGVTFITALGGTYQIFRMTASGPQLLRTAPDYATAVGLLNDGASIYNYYNNGSGSTPPASNPSGQ